MPRIPDFSPARHLQTRARADLQRFAVTQAAYARATQAAMPPGGGDATSRFLGQFRDEAQAMAARWSPDVRQRLAWRIDELGSELTGPLAEAEAGERRRYHVERQDALDAELLRTIAEHPDAAMRDAAEQQLTGAVPASPDLPQAAWDSRRRPCPTGSRQPRALPSSPTPRPAGRSGSARRQRARPARAMRAARMARPMHRRHRCRPPSIPPPWPTAGTAMPAPGSGRDTPTLPTP